MAQEFRQGLARFQPMLVPCRCCINMLEAPIFTFSVPTTITLNHIYVAARYTSLQQNPVSRTADLAAQGYP